MSINKPPGTVINYLESTLEKDISEAIKRVKNLVANMNSLKGEVAQTQFQSSVAPDITSLYSASILLKYFPEHKTAQSIILDYYEANLPFLKVNRKQSGPGQVQ